MDSTVNNLLEEGEKILWEEKPNYRRYMRTSRIFAILYLLLGPGLIILVSFVFKSHFVSKSVDAVITLAFLILFVIWYYTQMKKYKHLFFVFTNKRIFYPKTSFKEEYNSVEYSKISDVNLKIEDIDERYGTGAIVITEKGNTQATVFLYFLNNPQDVSERLKKIIIGEEAVAFRCETFQTELKGVLEMLRNSFDMRSKPKVIITSVVTLILTAAFFTLLLFLYNLQYMTNIAEQTTQVEFVEKRREKSDDSEYDDGCYVTFKFSDDSVQEIPLGGWSDKSFFHDKLYEGDTGKLTYKVDENNVLIRIVSFEKDPECGGIILWLHRRNEISTMACFIIGTVVMCPMVWLVIAYALGILKKDTGEHVEEPKNNDY